MGIPSYYYSIINKYGKRILEQKAIRTTPVLYIDYNSLIHQFAAENPSIDYIISETDKLLKEILTPVEKVYIAVDGQCPMAKMMQQRKRRYMSDWRKKAINDTSDWNSNIVTPGTLFMRDLDAALESYAKHSTHPFKIIVSPSSEEGEGEQKIFSHMGHDEQCVVFGLDADLIMLSMMHPNSKNITLYRGKEALHIEALKNAIEKEYEITINEYIILCFLLGNDFIPPLSFLKIKNNGIDIVIKKYKSIKLENSPLVEGSNINTNQLYRLFCALASCEEDSLSQGIKEYERKIVHRPHKLDETNIDSYPLWKKTYLTTDYYSTLFHGNDISKYCTNYIQGVYWTYNYYLNWKQASKTWYYPYNYSPLIKDIKEHFLHDTESPRDSEFERLLKQFASIQLLIVLPPSCSDMIPYAPIKHLMISIESGIYHYFPRKFDVETFLKQKLWECHPIMPILVLSELKNYIARVIETRVCL